MGGSEREVEDILLSERDGGKRAGVMAVLLMRSEPGAARVAKWHIRNYVL